MSPRTYRLGVREGTVRETRNRILDASMNLFARDGFHGATVDDIAREADVSRATVYHHFRTKNRLLEGLQLRVQEIGQLDRARDARQHPDPIQALQSFLKESCRFQSVIRPIARIAFAAAQTDPEVASVIDAAYVKSRRASVAELAQRLSDEGVLEEGWDAASATDAIMVLTAMESLETLTSAGRSTDEAADLLFAMATCLLRVKR